jgi:ABC-type nitrate/sulfonate/bicarbonate transport system substrate-binding protein
MRRIDVSLIAPAFTFVPLFAAQRRGFFERRGVECVYEYVGSGDAVTEALRTGRIQLAPSTPKEHLRSARPVVVWSSSAVSRTGCPSG